MLAVPNSISDNTINYAGRYRSRARIPALTYLHPVNNCSITRSSQPLVGVRQNRSIQDEKLLAAIFSTSRTERPLASFSQSSSNATAEFSQEDSTGDLENLEVPNAEDLEDEVIASVRGDHASEKPQIYGAQQHNLIVDARPTVNALAMQAVGLGSENMDNYKFATKAYLGMDNIHVMRDSLNRVVDALKDSDVTPLGPGRDQLVKSGWLKHIAGILDGAGLIARQVGLQHSHVLIHCSDGWDRTSQLSALSQLCLDPYYRTLEGFIILVEKDWLSFGHMFRHRSGFLNSEKWFHIENERIGGDNGRPGEDSGPGKVFENAFLSAKGFFNRDNNGSRDSLDSESDNPLDPDYKAKAAAKKAAADKEVTKPKETSPVFHQFLDATYQLLRQHPTRFEFNERFLRRLLYHLYSCQYGTFLYNNEKERIDARINEKTRTVWDYFLARKEQFMNPDYEAVIDDNKRGQERLIFPRTGEVRWWHEVFGRTDEEMNPPKVTYGSSGPASTGAATPPMRDQSVQKPDSQTSVLTGVETAEEAVGPGAPSKTLSQASSDAVAALAAGMNTLGFQKAQKSSESKLPMEVEMQ